MEKKLNFKKAIVNLLKEDDSFFYLAPDIIGSINNANLDLGRDTFKIEFGTTDGRNLALTVPAHSYEKWSDDNVDSEVKDFLVSFITNSKMNQDEEMLDEIVDEYGGLMADDDKPSNANFVYVGKSKFDTTKTIKQTIPKSKRFYGDLGLGVVTW